MSLNEFLNQLRRCIPERHAPVKPRRKSQLRVMGLEQRKLLDATAAFVLGELSLTGFDSGDVLTVSENMGSLDFQLTGGNIWGSTAGAGLLLVDPSTLRLSGAGVGNLDELDITATVADPLAAVNVNTALQLTNLQITNGGAITALDATNDFDAVSLSGSSVDLVDADDLTINVVTVSAGVDIAAATNVTISGGVSAGTDVDIESTNGTLQLAAGTNVSATGDVFLDAGTAVDIDGTIGSGAAVGSSVNIATDIDSVSVFVDGDIAADGAVTIGSSSLTGAVTIGTGTTITADSNNLGADDLMIRADGMVTQADSGSLLSNSGSVLIQSDLSDIEVSGVTATSGSIELTAVAGSITDSGTDTNVDLTAGSMITLTARDGINDLELANGSELTASNTLAGDISVNALGAISLTDVSTQDGSIGIDAGGTITATDVNSSATDDGTNDVSLTTTAGDILLGIVNAGTDNDVTLISAGAIAEVVADAGVDLIAGDAEMMAATGIGSSNAIETSLTNLAFRNSSSGHVAISNSTDLNIAAVGSLLTSSNSVGNVTLDVSGTLTFNASLTVSGLLTANAIESNAVDGENIVVSAGVTVESTAGNVVFSAGDRITIDATAAVAADTTGTQNITFSSGVGDVDLDGAMTLAGSVAAGSSSGSVTLNTNEQQGVVQNATGTISGDGILLLSDAASGGIDMDQSSTNAVNTIAADTNGAIAFRNSTAVEIDTVSTVSGVTTSNDNVTICATSIALAASVGVGTGTVRLSSTAGSVEQSSGSIIAASLGADATGSITLSSTTNDTDTFSARSVSGSVSYTDTDGFIVGTVGGTDCFSEVVGVTTSAGSGDITLLTQTGPLTINGVVSSGSGDIDVDANNGSVDISSGVTSLSGNVAVTGDAVTQNADVSTAAAGTISVIADVGSISMADGTTTSSAAGAISYDGAIDVALSELNSSGSTVDVTGSGGVITDSRTGEGAGNENITATSATLASLGSIGATDDLNTAVATLTVNSLSGSVNIAETDDIDLSFVLAANGPVTIFAGGQITASTVVSGTDTDANDIRIVSTGAGIEVGSVQAGILGDVILEAGNGNVSNSGATPDVIADDLSVTASGSISLDTTVASLNLLSTSSGDIDINESDAVALTNVVNANGSVDVTAAGTITAANVTAVTGNVTVDASTGDVLVDTITANSAGAVIEITARGNVADLNGDGAVDVSAAMGHVVVDAGEDIGIASADVFKLSATDPVEIDSVSMALTAGGDIAVHQTTATAVSMLTGGTVMLSSDGAVDLSAATPTATNLALLASTSRITLPTTVNMVTGDLRIEAGDVADTGGTIDLNAARLLFKSGQSEVISITADAFDGQSTGDLTVNSDSTALLLTDLDCDFTAINVGSNVAVLNSTVAATISQDLPATLAQNSRILSGSLVLNGQGTWNLTNGDNDTSILAADNTGDIVFKDINDVTIDVVITPANGTVNGVTAAGASVLLDIGTTLNVNRQLSADDDVRLQTNGTILQTAAGIITATNLGIRQLAANGGIQLAAQNEVDVFAAENAADGGAITFADRDEVSIGSVSASSVLDADFAGASGVVSTNGNVTLDTGTPTTGTNSLLLAEAVTAGSADVRIIADGNVTQTTMGVITADNLGVRQQDVLSGGVVLDQANVVNGLAVTNLADGGIVAFHNDQSLTVGTVSGLEVSASPTTAAVDFTESNGVTTNSGDVLLDIDGMLIVEQQINAGDAAIRINTDGTISQFVTGEIVATHLGIQQQAVVGNVSLGDAGNDVDILAVTNVAEAGEVTFFDADDLIINEVASLSIGQLDFVAASGIDTNSGDINVTSTTDLTIERRIDAVHETLSVSIDESITLISRAGDFVLADGVVITADETPTPGVFDDVTGDVVTILAGSSGTNGTVNLGSDVEVRTDGGVAKQISPRPTAFSAAPTMGVENAFVTLSDAEHMRSNLLFQNGEFLGVLDLVFGVVGEENLEVVVDWGAISQTSLTASGPAGDATLTPNGFEFDLSDADKTIFYIDEGGAQHLIPHLYSVTDLVTTSSDRNGRQINPNIFGVRFSVAQHESINIWGASATDPGTGATETPSVFSSAAAVAPVIDATGMAIDVLSPGLALLSSTDTNPLNEFAQQAAPLPFTNGVVTPTGTPEGLAEWEFIAGPTPGLIPYEPTERPPLEIPKIEAPFDSAIVSEIVGDVSFTAGAASDSAIGTQVYLQIRRYFELDSEAEVVIARITNNTFISNRDSFDQFVRDNPELQDGAGYEVWLVTETSGQRVERPIVKFEITGGRPGPATEELPDTFEPYELRDLEFEQPDSDEPMPDEGDMSAVAPKVPLHTVDFQRTRLPADAASDARSSERSFGRTAGGETLVSERPLTEDSNAVVADAASVLVPTIVFTKAARWKRRQAENDHDVSRTGRTIRRMKQKVIEK